MNNSEKLIMSRDLADAVVSACFACINATGAAIAGGTPSLEAQHELEKKAEAIAEELAAKIRNAI